MDNQWITLLPMILVFVAFYFFLIRPQQKRQKERMQMLNNLKKGDKVVTIGGLHGTIVDLTEEKVTLKVNENTRLVFERSAVNTVETAGETDDKKDKKEEKKEETNKAEVEESK